MKQEGLIKEEINSQPFILLNPYPKKKGSANTFPDTYERSDGAKDFYSKATDTDGEIVWPSSGRMSRPYYFYAKDFLTKEEMTSEDVPETDNSKEQSQKEIDFAEEEQIVPQEEQPVATETIEVPEVQENLEEVVIEEGVVLQELDEEIPQVEENIQEEIVDEISIPEDLNLSSMRLIIAVADTSVIRESTPVISSLDNMFLAQYESIEEAYKDYLYYQENAIFVEPDISFSVDTDTDVAEAEEIFMTQEENPFTELNNELSDAKTTVFNDVIIGLIDTGIGTNYNVVNSISVLDNDPTDYNGHGSKMADFILQENPDAKILSIKALDDNGIGTTSSVYSALKYAVESNVNVISMSFSSFDSADSNVIREIIEEAKNKGMVVIGSAGNKNLDVKYQYDDGVYVVDGDMVFL